MSVSRITDSMMNYGFLSGMNKSLNQQYALQEQMSDGKRVHRPSDDPVRVIRSLQYNSALAQNEQFTNNVKDASSWMELTDKSVGDLSSIMIAAKSLVVRAIEPSPDIGYAAAAKELDGLIDEAVRIANTQLGDRYIFSGQMDKTQPFERVQLADPKGLSNLTVDTVVYYGDQQKISMVTQVGAAKASRDGINQNGVDVFGRSGELVTQYGQATTDVFNSLIRIKEELQKLGTVSQTNATGGTLDVDGEYTGPNDYQDFAVKIDELKVRMDTYSQSNTDGGSLALSWTGDKAAMPDYPSPNSLRMRIEAIKMTPTVTAPVGHVTGALTMESTQGTIPVTTLAGNLQVRIDAVQVETRTIRQSNALAGALSVDYNGYTGTPPANLMVRTTTSPAADVVQTNATGGALTVTGITGSAAAASKVRIDAVLAGQVTEASYYDTATSSWKAATVVVNALSSDLTLGSTGIKTTVIDAGTLANDEYTLNATNRVTGVEYSDTGTWPGVMATPTFVSQSNADGGAATVTPEQTVPYKVEILEVDGGVPFGPGLVTEARVSVDGGLHWGATQTLLTGTVTLANGVIMTIANDADNVAGDTYDYKVPPVFSLNDPADPFNLAGNNIGIQVSIADSTENGVGAANTYTIPLNNTGKVMQASYSTDGGTVWNATTPDNSGNPFRFDLGGPFAGIFAKIDTAATNLVGDAFTVAPTITALTDHVTGALTIKSTAADTTIPAGELQFRVDALKVNMTLPPVMSNPTGGVFGVTNTGYGDGTAATATIPANLQVRIGAGGVGPGGVVTAADYSTDNGTTWLSATPTGVGAFSLDKDPQNIGIGITLGASGTNAPLVDIYTIAMTQTGQVMRTSYSTDHGASWVSSTAFPAVPVDPTQFNMMGTVYAEIGTVATNAIGDIQSVKMTDGEVSRASYSINGVPYVAATQDITGAGKFTLGETGFSGTITTNSTNGTSANEFYTLQDLSIDTDSEATAVSYSLDRGNNWIKATAPAVTKSKTNSGDLSLGGHYTGLPAYQDLEVTAKAWKVTATINQSNAAGGTMQIASNGVALPAPAPAGLKTRIDTVDSTNGRVTALSYSMDSGTTWATAGPPKPSQGPNVFDLGGGGLYVTIKDNIKNAAGNTYTPDMTGPPPPVPTVDTGDPALISYTTTPAPDATGTLAASSAVWSMKDSNINADNLTIRGFALPDGVTADIEVNSNNDFAATYSFRVPPRFTLQDGIEVSIDPNTNNKVKDAYTFHMPHGSGNPDHNPANSVVGPDLDWLSDKGLADLDKVHDQVLTSLTAVGSQASMYEMTYNLLETSKVSLTAALASNEDLDMAKAIIDMKTAENNYKASLSFGARIMPTSLLDFLR